MKRQGKQSKRPIKLLILLQRQVGMEDGTFQVERATDGAKPQTGPGLAGLAGLACDTRVQRLVDSIRGGVSWQTSTSQS